MASQVKFYDERITVKDAETTVSVEFMNTIVGTTYSIRVRNFEVPRAGVVLFSFMQKVESENGSGVAPPREDWRNMSLAFNDKTYTNTNAVEHGNKCNWIKWTVAKGSGPLVVTWDLCDQTVYFICKVKYETPEPPSRCVIS